jgi:hypothetical protein
MTREEERQIIARLFEQLTNAPLQAFPSKRGKLQAPLQPGVYVIYDPRGDVDYVGRNVGSRLGGLQARLVNHRYRAEKSSFRCLVVKSQRRRALLEAYATGHLCPKHLPTGENVFDKSMRSRAFRASLKELREANATSTAVGHHPLPAPTMPSNTPQPTARPTDAG